MKKMIRGVCAAALSAGLALGAAPAYAAPQPSDTKTDAPLASDVGSDIQDIVAQAAQLTQMEEAAVQDLQRQVADTQADYASLTAREQGILDDAKEALDNAAVAVEAMTGAESTTSASHTAARQSGLANSFRFINGQPIAEALQNTAQETAAAIAYDKGEPKAIVDALAEGRAKVKTGETAVDRALASPTAILLKNNSTSGAVLSDAAANRKMGIDVSYAQKNVDWEAAKEAGVQYAILRLGYGDDDPSQDDAEWARNAAACERLGIPYGVYLYSYAENFTGEASIDAEVQHCLRLLQGRRLTLPVYIDLEENSQFAYGDTVISAMAARFCKGIEDAGYRAGVYANATWWRTVLHSFADHSDYSRWVAQWPWKTDPDDPHTLEDFEASDFANTYAKPYQQWQIGVGFDFAAFSGGVDMDFWYGDLQPNEAGALDDSWYTAVMQQAPQALETIKEQIREAARKKAEEEAKKQQEEAAHADPIAAFEDVPADAFYVEPLRWALRNAITSGTTAVTFSPDMTVTRGQMAVFLWRAAGSPEADTSDLPFADVKPDSVFAKAIAWAVAQGITSGTTESTFSPDLPCSRGQVSVFLYRMAGSPDIAYTADFDDLPASPIFASAVSWVYQMGIASGTGQGLFSPDTPCARAQAMTFLYNQTQRVY